jgi:hypothetical protein
MPRITTPDDVFDRMEELLNAQLQALRELRKMRQDRDHSGPMLGQYRRKPNRVTHVDLAFQVLVLAEKPLHVYEIVRQIQHHFDITVKWESVVSTLVQKVAKGEQFVRTGKNTFGLVGRDLL